MPQVSDSCAPAHFNRLSRRGFLSVGVLAGTGLTLPQWLAREARADLKNYENFSGTCEINHPYLPPRRNGPSGVV